MKQGAIMTTLADVLAATKPPIELLDHLTRCQGRGSLPAVVVTWLERWRRIYAGDPDPLLDELTNIMAQERDPA